MVDLKKCIKCELFKENIDFRNNKKKCIECDNKQAKQWKSNNKQKIKIYNIKYRKENAVSIKKQEKQYRTAHKNILNIKNNIREKERHKNDPMFKLRHYISIRVGGALKSNRGSKHGKSILQYLSYTIDDLKSHIESKFEPWMNWNNRGKYNIKTWNNDDQLTWTWQLDHIIPHSIFNYSSMEDEAFKKCWALENLRPLSAKQNIIDGNRRSRYIDLK